jgi:hypothetical protein
MTSESNRISAASTAYIDGVCRSWGWSWSEMGQADDDGLDGLFYLRVMERDPNSPSDRRKWRHKFTGGLIHVQVKSGASYVVARTAEHIEVSFRGLDSKKELWLKSPLPVALIYVQEVPIGKTPRSAWWVDLKSDASYSAKSSILIPLKNRFQPGIECRRPFERLASGQHRRLRLQTVDMTAKTLLPIKLDQMSKKTKDAAIDFYRLWKASNPTNPALGPVVINRTGWSHITRVDRPVSRIQASFELLPAAARIVSEIAAWQVLRRGPSIRSFEDGTWAVYEYLGLSATARWPARAPSEVMVILRRQTIFTEDSTAEANPTALKVLDRKTWFYSVYEPGRRRREN